MKRPKKYTIELAPKLVGGGTSTVLKNMLEYYQPKDIDPLLDRLEQLEHDLKFPTLEQFKNDYMEIAMLWGIDGIYEYLTQHKNPRPSKKSVMRKALQLGLTADEIEILAND